MSTTACSYCRLISETSLYLLALTVLASLLHLLFEFLALRSDISFWQGNKSLAGLSARTVVTDLVSQAVVFLFLLDSDTSLLVTGGCWLLCMYCEGWDMLT